jgi:hypothetical protein
MSDLVRMRKHSGGKPKLGGAVAFSVRCAMAITLDLSGNGSKWRPLGHGSALYNRDLASQCAPVPRGLSGAVIGDLTIWRPQWIYCPTALSGLMATWQQRLVPCGNLRPPAFTRYFGRRGLAMPYFKPPNIRNPNFAFKVASDLQTTCYRSPRLPQSQGRLDLLSKGFTSHPIGLVPTCLLGLYDLQRPPYQRPRA